MTTPVKRETITLVVQPWTRKQALSVTMEVQRMESWICRLEDDSVGGSAVEVLREKDGTIEICLYSSREHSEPEIKVTMGDQTASMLVRALETVWTRALGSTAPVAG